MDITYFSDKDMHPYPELCNDLKDYSGFIFERNITENRTCTEKYERYPVSGSCDKYIECVVSILLCKI